MHQASDRIRLVEPSIDLKIEFLDLLDDQQQAGEAYIDPALPRSDFTSYLQKLSEMSLAQKLPPGSVPVTTYWMVSPDRTILGVSKLRHHLTPSLEKHGGHIAYFIRPSQRRQGYGGLILALTLQQARARGIQHVRITCDTDNIGSARIIEKNGGILSGQMVYPGTGSQISQYWIET